MKLTLSQVEPFHLPHIDSNEAERFLGHLTGNESFDFYGSKEPKSLLFYSVVYKYPKVCSGHGYLLTIDIDTFFEIYETVTNGDHKPIIEKFRIGTLGIDYGGNLSVPKIYTS